MTPESMTEGLIHKALSEKGDNVETLYGLDYMSQSLGQLLTHPDYSLKALNTVLAISKMSTKQLEALNLPGTGD